jgi:hypothetical protein
MFINPEVLIVPVEDTAEAVSVPEAFIAPALMGIRLSSYPCVK